MDEVFEIVSRMSLKGLSLCRAVSREWNAMTYESYFLRTFCERTNSKFGFIVPASYDWFTRQPTGRYELINLFHKSQDGRSTPLDFNIYPRMWKAGNHFNFVQSGMKIEAVASPGLVLCSREVYVKHAFGYQYFVCKPSTKQWRRIPNPRTKFFTEIIAMSAVSHHSGPLFFKIVRFSEPKINQRVVRFKSKFFYAMKCEIFDSRTWSWKRLKDLMLPEHVIVIRKQGLQACGVLHWITSNDKVFAFDINTEEWTIFGLPDSLCFKDIDSYELANYKGRLAFLVCKEKESSLVELWVLKDYVKNKVWTKEKTVNCETVTKRNGGAIPVAMYSSDAVVWWTGWWSAILHNFEHDSTDEVKSSNLYWRRDAILFQTDMESCGLCEVRKPSPEGNLIPAASTRSLISTLIRLTTTFLGGQP